MGIALKGVVERVTFSNEENGYSVVQVKIPGRRGLVTAVGSFASLTPGEVLTMEGAWDVHPRYGEQFKVERYQAAAPASVQGIQKYLGSGLVKGIGPIMAERIVARFGVETLDIIDSRDERLLEVDGIGRGRLEQIRRAWVDQREIRDLMVFLQGHGVSPVHATRIYKQYGGDARRVVQENPYRLASDISGIGFLTADRIARGMGFAHDSLERAEAGLLHAAHQASEEGHVCLPGRDLLERAQALLDIPGEILESALSRLVEARQCVAQPLTEPLAERFGDPRAVYLRGYHFAEVQAAQRLLRLQALAPLQRRIEPDAAVAWLQGRLPFRLAPLQEQAVRKALTDKVVIVTGGPGTGKTTLVQAILTIYRQLGGSCCLGAPTGRAAKRLSEATRHPASTLHRLLEFSPQAGRFLRDDQKPLTADCVIVDECSMLDVLLMHHLLKAVPGPATLVLVGDVDQLPSVGPGNVLRDLIACEQFPVVRLQEIFRQARESQIVVNAHRVQQGKFPRIPEKGEELQDFYFIEKSDPEEVVQLILKLCAERIPKRFGLDPVDEIQVLSPMNRGMAGSQRLNSVLQAALNPGDRGIERGGMSFREGDKVMQIRNNYDKDVFNGDWGRIRRIDLESQELRVEIDGREIPYELSDLDELVLAYSITVHKAQGSEYPAVIVPVLTQHYMMLQRNLLYTAITRARKLAVIVGSRKALAIAIKNDRMLHRFTLLSERLRGLL
ncbi:MAG: ATP-dependent RecD-like DNA helicase [Syntrophobacteraceae bacterium]|nr:ATP-dependent RecD-like DNA helicase [Syntrophobacteraceae bacterium]